MRLHHLEATAFGPFADTVAVDFDQLSDAGLFLLTGATGAGKTSVLDAVCFALYGDVPGDRNAAKRLRSDQAAPGLAPCVTLEATLSGRRFRIIRSPAWERPKKRGTGTTSQQASVTISERIGGAWQPLSSRLDETGHLISRLVGMNVTQFTQVAMLPQGRFQAFLRARSDERHRLLQQLFRTGRFEDVERWLRAVAQVGGPAQQGARGGRRGELVDVPLVGQRGVGRLADPADQVGDGLVARFGPPSQCHPAVAEPALDVLEPPGAEEALQQLVALLGLGAQERLEASLGQHRHLGELREVHPDEVGHQVPGLVEATGQRGPGPGDPLGDRHGRLLSGRARAALLRTLPRRRADDPEPASGQGRLQGDGRGHPRRGLVAAQPLGDASVAGDVAVQREADGVEDAGLAGARGAGEQEQPGVGEPVEVDHDVPGEGSEGLDL